jgi:hypothetical protein
VAQHLLRDTAHHEPLDPAEAVGAHDDQARTLILGGMEQNQRRITPPNVNDRPLSGRGKRCCHDIQLVLDLVALPCRQGVGFLLTDERKRQHHAGADQVFQKR